MNAIKRKLFKNLNLAILISIYSATFTINVSYGAPWKEFLVKSAGNTIGKSYAPNAPIFSNSGYYFSLVAPDDGASSDVQVQSNTLYYTSPDCSGDTYISSSTNGGVVVSGYNQVNQKSLFYIPQKSQFLQLKPLSYRDNKKILKAFISFKYNSTGTISDPIQLYQGYYVLSLGNYVTERINWDDTNEQVKTKIITGIPIIKAAKIHSQSSPTYSGSGTAYALSIEYQTSPHDTLFDFTVTENTLIGGVTRSSHPGRLSTNSEVLMQKTIPGTCVLQAQQNDCLNILNTTLTKVLPNDSTITEVSDTDFPQPITYEQGE